MKKTFRVVQERKIKSENHVSDLRGLGGTSLLGDMAPRAYIWVDALSDAELESLCALLSLKMDPFFRGPGHILLAEFYRTTFKEGAIYVAGAALMIAEKYPQSQIYLGEKSYLRAEMMMGIKDEKYKSHKYSLTKELDFFIKSGGRGRLGIEESIILHLSLLMPEIRELIDHKDAVLSQNIRALKSVVFKKSNTGKMVRSKAG